MLDQAEINVGRLLFWVGMALGFALLVANIILRGDPALGPLGVAVIVLATGHGVRRSVAAHDEAIRDAFKLGRDHEQSLRSLR